MFARVNTLYLPIVLALCASAASLDVRNGAEPTSGLSCNANTGTQQCCNSLNKLTDPILAPLLGLLDGLDLPIDTLVGLSCTPIVGTTQCNSEALCCTGNTIGGLITIGCSPVNVGL